MSRITRAALIQVAAGESITPGMPMHAIKQALIERHVALIAQAAAGGAQVCCLQELFFAPYFPAEQDAKWLALAEKVAGGATIVLMQELAKKHGMVLIVPILEAKPRKSNATYYNTAVVIDQRGEYLGKYRKHHIPQLERGFWEKYYFRPGDGAYAVFETPFGKIGVYICYDRHFPEGARELGLAGAEIVFNPSATVAGLSEYLWKLEQPAHAVANQYYVGAINRVGVEKPWSIGEFYGSSYFCDPRGQIVAQASRDKTEVLIADLDLGMIEDVRRTWPFYSDRRPETYARLTKRAEELVPKPPKEPKPKKVAPRSILKKQRSR